MIKIAFNCAAINRHLYNFMSLAVVEVSGYEEAQQVIRQHLLTGVNETAMLHIGFYGYCTWCRRSA